MKNTEQFDPTYETWPMAKLKRFHMQDATYTPHTAEAIDELAADISKNGLRTPLDILPDGTILGGHGRLRAIKQLGWKEVDVFVRHDLERLGRQAIIDFFVDDNRNRRQLSTLEQVKAAILKCGHASVLTTTPAKRVVPTTLKDRLAKACGMERRNLDRWLRVLRTPDIVQTAASRELLTLESAGKIAGLAKAEQEELAELVQSYLDREAELGAKLRDNLCKAVKRRLDKSVKPRRSHDAMPRLVEALRRAVKEFPSKGHVASINAENWVKDIKVLRAARRMLTDMIDRIEGSGSHDDQRMAS